MDTVYDTVIIGAGPAGLTAAIYARRAEKKVLVLEKGVFGGQVTFSPKIENYPGFGEISGNELADKFLEHAIALGTEFEMENVTEIKNSEIKEIVTENGSFFGKTVIIATGAKHRCLSVDGEKEFMGKGISFCAVCDGAFYNGLEVCVIGGGNSALQEAILLSDNCKKVTVIQNLPTLTGEEALRNILSSKDNVEVIYSSVVTRFEGESSLNKVVIKNADGEERAVNCDGVFIAIGLEPATDFVKNCVQLDEYGYVKADEACVTDREGIFVAGDCRSKSVRQIATACADGAAAALAAVKYLS